MPKTITIEIHEPYLKVLSKWASVSRTLKTAKSCTAKASTEGSEFSEVEREKYAYCEQELEDLIPALDHLHVQAREQLWQVARAEQKDS